MKSLVVLPYCPLPANTGSRIEMWKHLDLLRELGPCTVLSARRRPVGMGWSADARAEFQRRGFEVIFREDDEPRGCRPGRLWGMAYATGCKMLRLERAFGHANPYHRLAFEPEWVHRHAQSADLAMIHYSYWAGIPCACPKVVVLHDLLSDYMWGGPDRETDDLQTADLVIVISRREEETLRGRGIDRTLWSPPFVSAMELPDANGVGMVGSTNEFNREGLHWLGEGLTESPVKVYGGLAALARAAGFEPVGRYGDGMDPYRQCGIILMTTAEGMGVQIKSIEALAAGRAIVARRGAMRGIPPGEGAWIEVDTPDEMRESARRLQRNPAARRRQMEAARAYYRTHLDADRLRSGLREALLRVAKSRH